MTSQTADQGTPARHRTSRLLSRLRCGLQSRLLCTGGLSCRPSSSSESTSNLSRRRAESTTLDRYVEAANSGRKRLRTCDRKSSWSAKEAATSADSGVGRSPETLDRHVTSGHVTSGLPPAARPTYDVSGCRHERRRSTRLSAVDESDAPQPEVVTWSRDRVTGYDVIASPMTTRQRRKVPERRGKLHSCCNDFYGMWFTLCFFTSFLRSFSDNWCFSYFLFSQS